MGKLPCFSNTNARLADSGPLASRTIFMCVYLASRPDPRSKPWQTCAITLPAEITAAAVIIGFWDHNVRLLLGRFVLPNLCLQSNHVAIYVAILIAAVYSVNLFGTRYGLVVVVQDFCLTPLPTRCFGNSEYFRDIFAFVSVIGSI